MLRGLRHLATWASHHRPGDKWAVLPIEVDTVCPDKHDRKWSLRPCELEVPQYQCITVSGGFVNHKSQAIINLDELSIPHEHVTNGAGVSKHRRMNEGTV